LVVRDFVRYVWRHFANGSAKANGEQPTANNENFGDNFMNITLASAAIPSQLKIPTPHDIAKSEKAARNFEAMLLTPVLDALQKTFSGAEDSSTPGASDYRLMGTQALAQSIAARGGIGIGQLILRHLQPTKVPGGGGTGV
jgi:hypothetical protein